MPSADVNLARGEARDTVMESMAHVKLTTNSNNSTITTNGSKSPKRSDGSSPKPSTNIPTAKE